jgi:hypothetical protein
MMSEPFMMISSFFFDIRFYSSEDDDLWDENEDSWNIQSDDSETIQRDIVINNVYAGIIIGRIFLI